MSAVAVIASTSFVHGDRASSGDFGSQQLYTVVLVAWA